ncbi:CAP domain-containing protein [Candidatus Daviesbacteria bacterium]|nr:CAP domain-containing protein [Candidatus Daviesbacteria bacterium]
MFRLTVLAIVAISFAVFAAFGKPAYAADLIASVNNYRTSKGLPALRTDPYTCSFASARAQEAANSFSHTGFYNRVNSKTLPYPRYRLVTENLAWAPGGQDVVNMWINSPTHAANLLKNTTFACIGQYGDYFAFEGWKS